ncbi:DUF7344 domain-containing protein [Halobellus sp. GM3]|uniref:DUF7344 domain-containing protein n=1 Tax=Halobellus sp. GM3 TaxID=3458410 RepID=UPI00403DE3C1
MSSKHRILTGLVYQATPFCTGIHNGHSRASNECHCGISDPIYIFRTRANSHRRRDVVHRTRKPRTDGGRHRPALLGSQLDATIVRTDEVDVPNDDHRRRVRTELYHNHLPKLQICGMIEHDTETGAVRNASSGLGRELLTVVESHEPSE